MRLIDIELLISSYIEDLDFIVSNRDNDSPMILNKQLNKIT